VPLPEAERRETVPRDRQTVPYVVRVVDDDPHLVDYEQRGFHFPEIFQAYGHIVRPIVQTANSGH